MMVYTSVSWWYSLVI